MQSCDTNKKKIKGATRKNGEVDGTCRPSLYSCYIEWTLCLQPKKNFRLIGHKREVLLHMNGVADKSHN